MPTLWLARALTCLILISAALPACAQGAARAAVAEAAPVTLESRDGSIAITGALLGFDGAAYTLRTAIGEIEVPAANVRCRGDACPAPVVPTLAFSGARTLGAELIPALIDAYSIEREADMILAGTEADGTRKIKLNRYTGEGLAAIRLAMRGSSAGLRDLSAGIADIALTTRLARSAEAPDQTRVETVLALDGLLVVTAPGNPVRALSMERIAAIFSGEVRNWADLGGQDAPIRLIGRAPDTGTGSVFNALVMVPERRGLDRGIRFLASDAEVSDAVRADPGAIGFTSFSNERGTQSVAIRGVCGIQTPATAFTIKTEEYPLTRRLFAYSAGQGHEMASDFLAFAVSEPAQPVIARTGLVDQGVSGLPVNEMGLRFVAAMLPSDAQTDFAALRRMVADLVAADRLSITFRFENGSSRLDSRARADLERLAQMIRDGSLANKELLLLGFTDSVGRADINLALSQTRAEETASALRALLNSAGSTRITPVGHGEMSPLGCNETANGRRINRRVEVWTRDIAG